MKILILNQNSEFKYNRRLHGDFLRLIESNYSAKLLPGNIDYKDFKSEYNTYKPDCFLTYNSNGSSIGKRNYERFIDKEDCIKYVSCKKFHITTDFMRNGYDSLDAKWLEDMGYSQAIMRHKSSTKYDLGVDKLWLPFSVDRKSFINNCLRDISNRKRFVSFCGSYNKKNIYPLRDMAIEKLVLNNKIVFPKSKKLIGDSYQKFLSNYMVSLTCGGKSKYLTAKYFEIIAAGSFMICGKTEGLDLIPKGYYFDFDEKNISSAIEQAYKVFSNPRKFSKIVKEAQNYVLVKHNNEKRARELIKNMEKYL